MAAEKTKLRVINCIEHESLDSVRRFLTEHGFLAFELDGRQIVDAESFFIEAVRVFPQDPQLTSSVNWDAFSDSLWGGLDELGKERVAFIWTNAQRMLEHGLDDLLIASGCFEQLAGSVATPKYGISRPVTLVVFLIGEGNNFKPFLADKVLVH